MLDGQNHQTVNPSFATTAVYCCPGTVTQQSKSNPVVEKGSHDGAWFSPGSWHQDNASFA
jgi:hypothetical protein